MRHSKILKAATIGAAVATILAPAASIMGAQSSANHTVTATVNATITVTAPDGTAAIPAVNPGSVSTSSDVATISVTTNSGDGYTLAYSGQVMKGGDGAGTDEVAETMNAPATAPIYNWNNVNAGTGYAVSLNGTDAGGIWNAGMNFANVSNSAYQSAEVETSNAAYSYNMFYRLGANSTQESGTYTATVTWRGTTAN